MIALEIQHNGRPIVQMHDPHPIVIDDLLAHLNGGKRYSAGGDTWFIDRVDIDNHLPDLARIVAKVKPAGHR